MNLNQPTLSAAVRQVMIGVFAVTAMIIIAIAFGCCYYQAVGRVDWMALVRQ